MNVKMTGPADTVRARLARALRSALSRFSPASRSTAATPLVNRKVLVFAGAGGLFVTAAAIGVAPLAPDAALLPTTRVLESLDLPDLDAQLAPQALEMRRDYIREERVQRGDSVAALLQRLGVDDPELERFLRATPAARSIYQLYPGRTVQVSTNAMGEISWLRYLHTPGVESGGKVVSRLLHVERGAAGLSARDMEIDTERQVHAARGEIYSSLFGATDQAGIPDSVATQVAEILSGDIDFHRDLRRGDHFHVVYETYHHQGSYVRAGRVLSLEFVNKNTPYQAVWFAGQAGTPGGYYTFDGKSLRKAFLRSPMEFTRVTSGFSRRFHPILKTWREHRGVDYGAPSGTPIRTTADGNVDFIGRQNGYGNVVVIRHHGQYTTLYAHMSAFAPGLKQGSRVSQGQMIGRVGATGWATGPHLHYEFRIAGKAVDPLTVALPQAPELTTASLAAFKRDTEGLRHQMALLAQLSEPVTLARQ